MKTLLPLLLFILLFIDAGAQKIRFADTSNVWYQFSDAYNDGAAPILSYSTHNFINAVTIHSIKYAKFDFGIVREDTLLRKVYMRDITGDSDLVLIDYNLSVGDTFHINGASYVVSSIDSTLINGMWYKVWHFPAIFSAGGTNWPSDIVEGIGCIQHPTYMFWHGIGIEPIDPKVYCFYTRGVKPSLLPEIKWFDNMSSCTTFPTLNVSQILSVQNKVSLYPNPAISSLIISAPDRIKTIEVTSVLGQQIFSSHYNSTQIQVDVAGLPAGVYFIKINGTEVRKFVKE